MTDKLDFYDILAMLIPGSLIILATPILFPDIAAFLISQKFPDGFVMIGLVALSIFIGQIVQAIASLMEPVLYWTWGGRPSEHALRRGLGNRYFPADTAKRIRDKLVTAVGQGASDRSLFLYAMTIAENKGAARVSRFNGLYAYHRVLFVMAITTVPIYAASFYHGFAYSATLAQNTLIFCVLLLITLLFWHRAKQRGFYYVREVLLFAERNLASQAD
jgi:hypothetical protein